MNVSKQIKIILIALCGFPLLMEAQSETRSEIYQGQTAEEFIQSLILPPSITKAPTNGTATWLETGTVEGIVGFNTLIYNPVANFVGQDTIEVSYWRPPAVATRKKFIITVMPSKVFAEDDYAYTESGQPIMIDVLANDTQTNGVLTVKEILVANHAENVTIDVDGQISFYPDASFQGIANLSYLVCNDIDICDIATVSVEVKSNTLLTNDTLHIFTTRYEEQAVLISTEGFILEDEPTKGWIDDSNSVLHYVPNGDQTGTDVFRFESLDGAISKIVNVTILDRAQPNLYATDDFIYTPVGQAVEFDVLANDSGTEIEAIQFLQQPRFGTLSQLEDGLINYEPRPGFTTFNEYSVDRFSYQITLQDGTTETATAYVYINNFNPSASTFELQVAKNSPLAIQYAVPINYAGFEIVTQGDLGRVSFHESINQEVLGQRVVGKKVLLYTPATDAVGTDEFEVQYCVSTGNCKSIKIRVNILDVVIPESEQCVLNDCVWEGDTNNDGVVNMQDLLALGHHIGETGEERTNTTTAWLGQASETWNGETAIHQKDSNGDGVISSADTTAISQHYGKTHKITPVGMPPTNPLPIYYGKPDTIPVFGPGAILEIPIILGSEYFQAEDIYGLTFEINYSPNIFVEGSAKISFDNDSWLTYGSPALELSRENITGRIDVGFTKTNGKTSNGFGKVATFTVITVLDIDSWRNGNNEVITPLTITASAINGQGQTMQLGTDSYSLKLALNEKEEVTTELIPTDELLTIYPNPSAEVLNLQMSNSNEVQNVEVLNLTGQKVYEGRNINQIIVKGWSEGTYLLRVYTSEGEVVNKKFEVFNN